MKIIYSNNYFYLRGGSEKVLFDEIELFQFHGHEVIPFSMHFEKNYHSPYVELFAPLIRYENISFFKKILVSHKLIYSKSTKNKFTELIDMEKPELIHAHNIYGRLTTSIIDAAKEKNVPVVMTLHDYKLICPSYLMRRNDTVCDICNGRKFYNCMLARCHKNSLIASSVYTIESYFNHLLKKYNYVKYFICPSKFILKKHMESRIPASKLIYVPNFLNMSEFQTNFANQRYILFVGRLSKEKGALTLLKAAKEIESAIKIVGDGPMMEEYKEYVEGNNIKNVVFKGYQTGNELKSLYMNSTFVIFPSEWYENAPMAVLEAFAYGKPVIGANIGGIPEMVIDGETGLLFEPGNHEDLREKIDYLLNNPSKVVEMGKKAREKAEKEYNAGLHYQRLIDVYEKACA